MGCAWFPAKIVVHVVAVEVKIPSVCGGPVLKYCSGPNMPLPCLNYVCVFFLAHRYFFLSQDMLFDFSGSWMYVKGRVLSCISHVSLYCKKKKKVFVAMWNLAELA